MKFLLIVLAFIGIAGMCLYKFKYEQMKIIVEGAGLEAVDRYIHSYNLLPLDLSNGKSGAFESPAVSWVNISNYYVFSAFPCHRDSMEAHSTTQEFCGIGFGPDSRPALECSVWFDLGQDVISVPGTFSFTVSRTDTSSYVVYEFRCSVKDLRPIHRHPYVFILKTTDKLKNKVIVPIVKQSVSSASNRFALCVYPDNVGNEWKSIIEFFVYHDIAGFTDIIAYDSGVNFGFLDKMKYLLRSGKGKLKSLSILRWDFPSNDPISTTLVQRDCLFRTSGNSNFTALVNWNQFIVPHDQREISSSLTSMTDMKPTSAFFSSKRCCTDTIDDRRSEKNWPVILKKTLCIPNKVYYSNLLFDINLTYLSLMASLQ